MNKKLIIAIVVGVLVVGGGSFYAGTQYAKSKSSSRSFNFASYGNGQMGSGRSGQGFGGATAGKILSIDSKSVTVGLSDGGSRIVFFTENTPITKSAEGSTADLTVGESIVVMGQTNQDGSISAQSIDLGRNLGRFSQTSTQSVQN